MIIGNSLKVNGNIQVWTSAAVTSAGVVSASSFRNYNYSGSKALITDSSKNIVESSVTSAEIGYLTSTSANIQTQLTTLSGAKVNKTTQVIAGTGLTGGGALSANATLSLATTGTSGTYTKVTTDAYGRVISGTTLTSADIPTIPATKIQQTSAYRFVTDTDISNWNNQVTKSISALNGGLDLGTFPTSGRTVTLITLSAGTFYDTRGGRGRIVLRSTTGNAYGCKLLFNSFQIFDLSATVYENILIDYTIGGSFGGCVNGFVSIGDVFTITNSSRSRSNNFFLNSLDFQSSIDIKLNIYGIGTTSYNEINTFILERC